MYLKFSGSRGLVWRKTCRIQRHLFIFWQVVPRIIDFPDFDKTFDFRDGGGTITTVELGQVLLQIFNVQVGNCNRQVMRTFGWSPSEGELQELVGEIDQVLLFNNIIPSQLSTLPLLSVRRVTLLENQIFCERMEMAVSPSMNLFGLWPGKQRILPCSHNTVTCH